MDKVAVENYHDGMLRLLMIIAALLTLVLSPVAAAAHEFRMSGGNDQHAALHDDGHSAVICEDQSDCAVDVAVCKAVCLGLSVPLPVLADVSQYFPRTDVYVSGPGTDFREALPDEDSRPPISPLL